MNTSGKTEKIRKRSIISKKIVKKISKSAPAKKKSTRFQPGQSGNPKGRPKGTRGLQQAKTVIQNYIDTGKRLHPIQFLINVYSNPKSALKQRVDAAKIIAAYLYGRPQQAIDVDLEKDVVDIIIGKK